jgi:hypothetical protein
VLAGADPARDRLADLPGADDHGDLFHGYLPSDGACWSALGQADGDGVRLWSGNRPGDLWSVPVVLGAIGGVDVTPNPIVSSRWSGRGLAALSATSPSRPMRSSSSGVHVDNTTYADPTRMRDLMARRSSMAA